MKMKSLIKIIMFTLLSGVALKSGAQHLPSVQKESVYAILSSDNGFSIWEAQFKAYNKSTSVFYTIANDDNNLYVIIKADKETIIEKIIGGGITVSIKPQQKDNTHSTVTFTYPLIPRAYRANILDTAKQISEINKQLLESSKEIRIIGIKEVADSTISIYNELGIKTAEGFDKNRSYIYELTIPLKFLTISTVSPGWINYNIKLNGIAVSTKKGADNEQLNSILSHLQAQAGPDFLDKTSSTDLSGTYILAKH